MPRRSKSRRWSVHALAALMALAWSAQISAEPVRRWQSGDWSMVEDVNPQTRALDHCRGFRAAEGGGTFGLGQLPNTHWVLIFNLPAPVLAVVNSPMRLSVSVDGIVHDLENAHLTSPTTVQFGIGADSELLQAMRNGRVMAYGFPDGQRGSVNLSGLTRMSAEVSQCVQTALAAQGGAQVRGTPVPPGGAAMGAPLAQGLTPPPAGSRFELAATRIASNLLLRAKLPNGRLLSPAESPPALKGLGAAWVSDAGLGSVMVLPAQPGKDVQQVALGTIVGGASACKGEFAAGRSTALVDDTLVTKTFIACGDSTGTRGLRHFIVHREGTWFVIYTIVPPPSPGGGASRADMPEPLKDENFQAFAVKAAVYE